MKSPSTGPPPFRVARTIAALTEGDAELQSTVERHRHGLEIRVVLTALRVLGERVGVRQDVVRDEERAGLDLVARKPEQPLVVVLLGVDEDDVEHVLNRRQVLECVALDELGPLVEPGLGDVRAPRLALARGVLEREDAAAEVAHARREPDRRGAAGAADLEHLAVGVRRSERVEEAPGRRRDLTGAQLARDVLLALAAILLLEA